jgi:quinoprotein glucose dehydrogenase
MSPRSFDAFVVAAVFAAVVATACTEPDRPPLPEVSSLVADGDWPAYGRDPGGSRFSPLAQVHTGNVVDLRVAWTFRTGDMSHEDGSEGPQEGCGRCHTGETKFEATPILVDGRLFVSTPMNRVFALDPAQGTELWRFDPEIKTDIERSEGFITRGVSWWGDEQATEGPCSSRIFHGTVDARLFALDADTGAPCREFGENGVVRLDVGVGEVQEGQYGLTSPAAIVGDVVVVGSSMGDNRRVDMERGIVRGYDARSGELIWAWDPIPRDPDDPAFETWTPEAAAETGGGNAWAPLSADPVRDLVFVPTGSAAPDFYGGERPGQNLYTNSVVALRASTGEVVWYFQVVHHDLWDYDVAAQPTLTTVPRDGRDVPAVVVGTKMGFVYVLHRETGEPLFPVEERPVPASTVPGEQAWPTQPFPTLPPPLHPLTITSEEAWGPTPEDHEFCVRELERLSFEGVFTPPGLEATLMFPGFAGGINWGGVTVDRSRSLMVTNVARVPMWVQLQKRPEGATWGNQIGTPYHMTRSQVGSPVGFPCNAPPFGNLVAVDLATGQVAWETPLGMHPELAEVEEAASWGSPGLGGPILTAGGLVFIGAARDDFLRAYDAETGEELWRGALPAGGQATPMTYEAGGRQYVVIAAGGHGGLGTTPGDYVVAFALPEGS